MATIPQIRARIRKRFWRALDYISIYVFVLVVWGGVLIVDYALLLLIENILEEDIRRYPLVALWFDRAKIGLALLTVATAVFHGIISTIGQIRMDVATAREDHDE